MKIAKELAKEAKKNGICDTWYNELKILEDKRAMVQMYLNGIDFCLANDYPDNEYIRANFKGMMEEFGVFLDDNIDLVNVKKCVALGATKGRIEVNGFGVSEIFVKHESALNITAKDNAFVMIDVFDDGVVMIDAQDNAKICVNKYGNARIHSNKVDSAMIKIIEKHKKTY
jgi:hypothetical protein